MKWILVQTPNGLKSTGCACNDQGQVIANNGRQGYLPSLSGVSVETAKQRGYAVLSQTAYAQALASKAQNPVLANQYQNVDVPGAGAVAVGRVETPGGYGASGVTYSVIFDNDNSNPVNDYKIFGDWPGTYAISQGLVPVSGSTLTIGGSAGALSLSHLTNRSLARPFRVSQLQLEAKSSTFYNSNPILYFDTTTNPQSGTVTRQLQLSSLIGPNQFRPEIQFYDVSELFDGTNGLRFNIPAGEYVTATFTVVSENSIHTMKQFS